MLKMTSEQLAYEHAKAVGWNQAVKAAAEVARKFHRWQGSANLANSFDCEGIAAEIEKLDKSVSAIDD
jgi:hypothetical protein